MLHDEATLPCVQLDADYTARATVTVDEFARIIGQYESLTTVAQNAPNTCSAHEFCAETGLKLDLYNTKPGEKRPVVVLIHGGYWRAYDKANYRYIPGMLVPAGATTVLAAAPINWTCVPGTWMSATGKVTMPTFSGCPYDCAAGFVGNITDATLSTCGGAW